MQNQLVNAFHGVNRLMSVAVIGDLLFHLCVDLSTVL